MVASLTWASVALLAFQVDAMQIHAPGRLPLVSVFAQGVMVGHLENSTVVTSNLGGMGPSLHSPAHLFFKNIGSTRDYENIDLTVTNTSEYTPGRNSAVANNGRGTENKSKFGIINVACGKHVNLDLAFTVNGAPATLEYFNLTLSDVDSNNAGDMHEYFGVLSPFQASYLYTDTELTPSKNGTQWTSTKSGQGADNPKNPNNMTPAEKTRAVTLAFVNASSIRIVLGVTLPNGTCSGARNMLFSFWSDGVPTASPTASPTKTPSPTTKAPDIPTASPTKTPSPTTKAPDIPTASPTKTPSPTASPTASPATAVGDPHMINVKGEKFDLVRSGRMQLLRVPLEAVAEEANLTVDAVIVDMAGSIDGCTTAPYIQAVTFGGLWLGGRSLTVSSKAGKMQVLLDGMLPMVSAQPVAIGSVKLAYVHPNAMELQLGDASIRVSHGVQMFHFFLNMQASSLSSLGYTLGGLLGGDDHRPFSTLASECFAGSSMRLASTSRAGTSHSALLASASLLS